MPEVILSARLATIFLSAVIKGGGTGRTTWAMAQQIFQMGGLQCVKFTRSFYAEFLLLLFTGFRHVR
jgi:hypothetical protein